MNSKRLTLILLFSLVTMTTMSQGTITTFRVDGLIISKARYDSLKIERSQILKVRSLPPTQAASAYGSRASAGVAEITTNKMFVVRQASGTIESASDPQAKETLLASIAESQILRIRNVDAQTLVSEFGKENSAGAVIVYLRE